jgi:hypothetical protein
MLNRLMLAAAMLFALAVPAQDTLFYKNGTKETVLVEEIGEKEIRYKSLDNPDGPDYVIRRNQVWRINYKNGTSQTFGKQATGASPVEFKVIPAPAKRSNYIGLNAADLVFGQLSFSYERQFRRPQFTGEATVSSCVYSWRLSNRGMDSRMMAKYYSPNKPLGFTCTGFYYKKKLQQVANLGFGAELGGGLYYYKRYLAESVNVNNPPEYKLKTGSYFTTSFVLNYKIIPADNLFVNFTGVLGAQYYYSQGYRPDIESLWVTSYVRAGLALGYRF